MFFPHFNTHIQVPISCHFSTCVNDLWNSSQTLFKNFTSSTLFLNICIFFFSWTKNTCHTQWTTSHNLPGESLFSQWRTFTAVFFVMFTLTLPEEHKHFSLPEKLFQLLKMVELYWTMIKNSSCLGRMSFVIFILF